MGELREDIRDGYSHLYQHSISVSVFIEDIEALLFGFQSIADTVDVSYSDVIPGLIGLIPLISANSVQLAETVMLTLGTADI